MFLLNQYQGIAINKAKTYNDNKNNAKIKTKAVYVVDSEAMKYLEDSNSGDEKSRLENLRSLGIKIIKLETLLEKIKKYKKNFQVQNYIFLLCLIE